MLTFRLSSNLNAKEKVSPYGRKGENSKVTHSAKMVLHQHKIRAGASGDCPLQSRTRHRRFRSGWARKPVHLGHPLVALNKWCLRGFWPHRWWKGSRSAARSSRPRSGPGGGPVRCTVCDRGAATLLYCPCRRGCGCGGGDCLRVGDCQRVWRGGGCCVRAWGEAPATRTARWLQRRPVRPPRLATRVCCQRTWVT
jgi:hypothetical protein